MEEKQIEQVVRQVLSRLSGKHEAAATGLSSPVTELSVEQSVVTLATITGKLDGIRRLIVHPRAVVTPAVRDLLKEKNIILVRSLHSAKLAMAQVAVALTEMTFDVTQLVNSLRQHGVEVQQLPVANIKAAARNVCDQVKSGKLGVLITSQLTQALCLANRRQGVRAAMASSRGDVNGIIRDIGANCVIVDPTRHSRFEVQRIVETFCLAGPRECPAELKGDLE